MLPHTWLWCAVLSVSVVSGAIEVTRRRYNQWRVGSEEGLGTGVTLFWGWGLLLSCLLPSLIGL